jgi:pimeloyl-ACP methyl ester carboxylesterase
MTGRHTCPQVRASDKHFAPTRLVYMHSAPPVRHVSHDQPGGTPVGLGLGCGLFHAGSRDTAVLICPPWGYEALCAYKSLRILADLLAESGYPVLRFDYPATGDSCVEPDALQGIDDWRQAVIGAAQDLQRLSGATRIVLCGLGLGTLLARVASNDVPALAGMVLLGPVNDGRRYLRELASWSAMIDDSIGLDRTGNTAGIPAIAGFEMPDAVARTLKAISAKLLVAPDVPHLVATRDGFAGDSDLVETLHGSAIATTAIPFEGFKGLLGDPTSAQTPTITWQAIKAWLDQTYPAALAPAPAPAEAPATQHGSGFQEEHLRFGQHGQFFGILCQPECATDTKDIPVYIIVNSGFDPHMGWARSTTDQARALARAGISSLRMDTSDIGDSPADPAGPAIILYSQQQIADVTPAIDLLTGRGYIQIYVTGRCAGAYVALNAAVADARIKGCVIVNLQRLVWDPEEKVEDAIRNAFRSFDNYKTRILQWETLKRILKGDIDVIRVAGSILRRIGGRIGVKLAPFSFGLTKYAKLRKSVIAQFTLLRHRNTGVELVYSADDGGLDELATYFGADGRALSNYPNASISMIANADHNITPKPARERLTALLISFARARSQIEHAPNGFASSSRHAA